MVGRCSLGEELFLFNGIEPNDVMQGSLGDCWLMSAIAAIAEFPSFIQSELFVTQALASDGKYTLRLYDARDSVSTRSMRLSEST